jgi:uncharacterized damage-inducible protein DinB
MELLEDVNADEARQHPVAGVHSIAELVPHITAWATAALRGLDGKPVELTEVENWPPVTDEYDWTAHLQQLRDTMIALGDRSKSMTDEALGTIVHGSGQQYPAYALLHGVVQHNLYHAGQLALLKKAIRTR